MPLLLRSCRDQRKHHMTTTIIANIIDSINSRTMAKRRIEQAHQRIIKARESVKLDEELITALQARHDALPVEAGSLTASVGETIAFKTGRAGNVREETGVVHLVDGAKYKVLVGEGFSQEFKIVFAGQITAVAPATAAAAADELGLNA